MADKTKTVNQTKQIPKDAQVILSMMKDMGITDYEPKVINQLLEFSYRYVTSILDDSKIYASHSKKKVIDVEDVRLAVKMQLEKSFTNPPPREVLLEVAKARNSVPLPFVKPNYGLRLPPDRYCLSGTNYKLKSPPKRMGRMGNIGSKANSGGHAIAKRPGTLATISKTQTISVPKPVLKVSSNHSTSLIKPQQIAKPKIQVVTEARQVPVVKTEIKTEVEESKKRKREDDVDEFSHI